MPSSVDVMHRYLKSRDIVDENAGLLASLIEADRGIDAVELEDLENSKKILEYSKLSYCLVNVDNHLLLLYPAEQRSLYRDVQPQLELGGNYVEMPGFTYSEASAARDLLDAAGIPYLTSVDGTGRISLAVSGKDEDVARKVTDTVMQELNADRDHFIARNICWQHAINQTSKAISYGGVSFIGSEGGISGIRMDKRGATISVSKAESRFVPRNDSNFDKKVLSAVLEDLNGYKSPVKAFYGDFADLMTQNMTGRAMSKNEALDILNLEGIPDIEECAQLYEESDDFSKKEKTAFQTVLRMSMCRAQKLEDIHDYKQGRGAEEEYREMHEENIKMFEEYSRGGGDYER